MTLFSYQTLAHRLTLKMSIISAPTLEDVTSPRSTISLSSRLKSSYLKVAHPSQFWAQETYTVKKGGLENPCDDMHAF